MPGHDEKSARVVHFHVTLAATTFGQLAAADNVDSVSALRVFRIGLQGVHELAD